MNSHITAIGSGVSVLNESKESGRIGAGKTPAPAVTGRGRDRLVKGVDMSNRSPAPATTPYRKRAIPGSTRVAVAERFGATPGETTPAACAYCGAPGAIWWPLTYTGRVGTWVIPVDLEWEHIFPEFHGGSGEPDNITLACRPCNRSKGHKVL